MNQPQQLTPEQQKILDGYAKTFSQASELVTEGKFPEAEALLKPLHKEQPQHIPTRILLGICARDQGQMDQAEALFRGVIKQDPHMADARSRLGELLLAKGEYLEGFEEYEWRWKAGGYESAQRNVPGPEWDGSDVGEKVIFVHTEQGVGDAIMFVRFISDILKRSPKSHVMLAGDPHLSDFFAYSYRDEPRIRVLKPESNYFVLKDPYDIHVPLMSLPRILKTTLESIPQESPYMDAPDDKNYGDGFKIGIAWYTKAKLAGPRRSMPLSYFERIAAIPGVTLVNLQYGDTDEERKAFNGEIVHDDSFDQTDDLLSFASQVKACDLVASIDNTTVHVAGALGLPSCVLLPYAADWRWLQEKPTTPWYPSLTLFRQAKAGDWDGVMSALESHVKSVLEK